MEIDYDKMKEYSERARVSFKKVAEDSMICNAVFFNIQEIRISTEKREQLNRKLIHKAELKPKQKRFQPKKTWFRTRSNPFNKRGGQRTRDKPVKQPQTSERK